MNFSYEAKVLFTVVNEMNSKENDRQIEWTSFLSRFTF